MVINGFRVACVVALGWSLSGCVGGGGGGPCLPETTLSCVCDDGSSSTRACGADGLFGACRCGATGADGGGMMGAGGGQSGADASTVPMGGGQADGDSGGPIGGGADDFDGSVDGGTENFDGSVGGGSGGADGGESDSGGEPHDPDSGGPSEEECELACGRVFECIPIMCNVEAPDEATLDQCRFEACPSVPPFAPVVLETGNCDELGMALSGLGIDVCDGAGAEPVLGDACDRAMDQTIVFEGEMPGEELNYSGSGVGEENNVGGTCGGATGPDAVMAFVAIVPGTYTAHTLVDTGYDTVVYLRTVCDEAGSEIACNDDDSQSPQGTLQSSVTFEANSEEPVFIVVDSYDQSTGDFVLTVRLDAVRD